MHRLAVQSMTAPRRRWRSWLALTLVSHLAATGVALVAAAPAGAQPAPSLCAGSAQGLTIAGDLAVPAGEACELSSATVTGDVVVRAGAALILAGSTIHGDLSVRADGFVDATGSRVAGTTVLRQAFGVAVVDSELDGGVDARNSGFFFSDGSSHGGEVFSRAGQTVILSGTVGGDVRTNQDLLTDLRDVVVTGGVTVAQAALGSVVCQSEVDGRAVFRTSGEVVQIGGGSIPDCEFNVFGADLVLRDNDALIEVNGNVVRGDLICAGNATDPSGAGNRVRGAATGQCAGLGSAPASPESASGMRAPAAAAQADNRITAVTERIDGRTSEVSRAVAQAGPADLG